MMSSWWSYEHLPSCLSTSRKRAFSVGNEQANERITIYGIDLGTTYSCIAYVDQYGKATVIPNAEGELTTPSVVLFEQNNRIVGKEAKNSAVLSPEHVVSMIKREMGNPDYHFEYDGIEYSPQEISSYILKKLALDAEQQIGKPVSEVVITCPAYFGLAEREATRVAGELAGLHVREIINEPTAAALDFGIQEGRDQVAMVYDLGGGTFDVTIIQIRGGAIQVVATGGDHRLGGRDWDEQVVLYLASEWRKANPDGSDPLDSLETQQDLWQKAETAKRTLTARDETRVAVVHDGKTQSVTLTRQQFDGLTRGKLEQTIQYTRETLEVARSKGIESFDVLLLVGGSTRMPQVKERLQHEFPNSEIKVHDPDQAVAKGAAIYGLKLAVGDAIRVLTDGQVGSEDGSAAISSEILVTVDRDFGLLPGTAKGLADKTVVNVTSHSYGVLVVKSCEDNREYISNLVVMQSAIPVHVVRTYGTLEANQETVEIKVLQNDVREDVVDDLSLGQQIAEATLTLPPNLPASSPIEVTCTFDNQGLLTIIAKETTQGGTVDVQIDAKGGLSAVQMEAARKRNEMVLVS
jgi:molecular chaperone DnaK